MGDDARAEPYYRRSLAIFEKARGPDHPDAAQALFGPTADESRSSAEWLAAEYQKLGSSYEDREEWEKAKEEYQRGVEVLAAAFGSAHWKTREAEWKGRTVELLKSDECRRPERVACSACKLSQVLRLNELGQYREALQLAEVVLTLYERLLGEHPDTAACLYNLANLCKRMGDSRTGRAAEPAGLGDLRESLRAQPSGHRTGPDQPGAFVPGHGRLRAGRAA